MAYEEEYSRSYWNDEAAPAIDEDNLNNMEAGIKRNDVRIAAMSVQVDTAAAQAAAAVAGTGQDASFISVLEDMELTIASYAHVYLVLAFGTTLHNVTFTPSEGGTITWINGTPTFEASSVYEISFLHLSAVWMKR